MAHSLTQALIEATPLLITAALGSLLTNRHLYQHIEIDHQGFLKEFGDRYEKKHQERMAIGATTVFNRAHELLQFLEVAKQPWLLHHQATTNPTAIIFDLPTIHADCSHCKTDHALPFNARGGSTSSSSEYDPSQEIQRFTLFYQCQSCKGVPICFLVTRKKWKFTISGRDPFERVVTPKCLPDQVSKYLGTAIGAYHSGRTLAALFYLRVFIEQFWRTRQEVQAVVTGKPKATGEEMGQAYSSTLPQDFRSRFPSLLDIYSNLSAAIHAANEDAALFETSVPAIVKHFEARRLFELS